MTEKKSQITIPINPTNLFTTVFGVGILVAISYFAFTVPDNIKSIDNALVNILGSQVKFSDNLRKTNLRVEAHATAINKIENTRFDKSAAQDLSKLIITEMKIELHPVFIGQKALELKIASLEQRMNKLEAKNAGNE